MGTFRDELFCSLALGSPHGSLCVMEKDAKIGVQRSISIALYANGKSMLRNLDSPVLKAKSKMKYHNVQFNLISGDFDDAEQANVFNLADAVIVIRGSHGQRNILIRRPLLCRS